LISSGIFLWNSTCLLIGKILEYTNFDGILILFVIGIPILITIITQSTDKNITFLLTNLNKLEKGEIINFQIRKYIELIEQKDADRESKALLIGYISGYEENCTLKECALKKYTFNYEQNKTEIDLHLYQHAEYLYQNGISKFPFCVCLRISYALFILNKMNRRQQANIELVNAEKYSPTFEEQFIIYRNKKLIEEKNNGSNCDNEKENNLDLISNVNFKNDLNQCNDKINYIKIKIISYFIF
jgi:hypothetical protein